MVFRQAVLEALTDALGERADEVDLTRLLSDPPRPEMGDLAFGCFPLAKIERKAPPAIAQELAERIPIGGLVAKVTVAGPFVNFHADPVALLDAFAKQLADGSFFDALRTDAPQRIMVEFSQPNTHKVFHVGHLRNVVLGDALVRVLKARGHDVVPVNYYGDFGIDVAKCLWWLRAHPAEPPAEGRTAWLGAAYAKATEALENAKAESEEAHAALSAEIRGVLAAMEEEGSEVRALYLETRQWCLDEFAQLYANMGVHFDHDFFESELEEAGNKVVDDYLAKGVFEESQGAIICDLSDDKLVPALVRKSDGTSLYMTWDLALAREKFEKFDIQRSLYVVATEQTFHFQQLFATLRRMGYQRAKDCRHVAYELVMLPEGKMSSRKGTATPLHELRSEVLEAIKTKMREEHRAEREGWTEAHWIETAMKVMRACLKYGMLQVGNNRTVVFDVDAWTNPEGDTGAYLLYSQARIAGIFRKAGVDVELAEGIERAGTFGGGAERQVLNHLLKFGDVVRRVEDTCDPSHLANYLFDGAKRFSRFYQECPVLKADEETRAARLLLIRATDEVFGRGLELLGIETVDEM